MKPPIAALAADERKRVCADIYYLNLDELREFCDAHGIPYLIHVETPDGRLVRTRDADRKGIVIDRVLHFLKIGTVKPETVFRKEVVAAGERDGVPIESDKAVYGRYRNGDPETLRLMKRLTSGKFEFGAIAQEVLRACWSRNQAPTYREFARLWEQASAAHSKPNPEWAFLSDLARGTAGPDWKKTRNRKAAAVMSILKALP